MNLLPTEKTMTTKEIARNLKCSERTVARVVKQCLPNKKIENGKKTTYTEEEVTVLLDWMKMHNNRTDLPSQPVVEVAETSMSLDLQIQKLYAIQLEGEKKLNALLDMKNKQLEARVDELEHQMEYNEVIDWSPWKETKKRLGIKKSWESVCEEYGFEEDVDFKKKCMGMDKYPTTLLMPETVKFLEENI